MVQRRLLFLIVTTCFAMPTLCQTASQLSARYKLTYGDYSVSENLMMRPSYDRMGQICRAHFFPNTASSGNRQRVAKKEWKQVFNKFAPPKVRGLRTERRGHSIGGGGVIETTFSFDRILLIFSSFYDKSKINWDAWKLSDTFDFELPTEAELKLSALLDPPWIDDFERMPEEVDAFTIIWKHRECNER